jgi:hypothetical protein
LPDVPVPGTLEKADAQLIAVAMSNNRDAFIDSGEESERIRRTTVMEWRVRYRIERRGERSNMKIPLSREREECMGDS